MAQQLAPQEFLEALHAEGCNIYEDPGWRDRCRCHNGSHERGIGPTGRGWGPINGITMHHTAGPMLRGQQAIDYTKSIIIAGNGSTPGPLSHVGIDADGRVILVAAGRCNHIGSISQASLNAMKSASFSMTSSVNLRGSGVDGNTHTYGAELYAPNAPNEAQQEAFVRFAAAICRVYGWDGGEVHGHGEASDQRDFSDPGVNMGTIRSRVRARLGASPAPPTDIPTQPSNPTQPQEEDPMFKIIAIPGAQYIMTPQGVIHASHPDTVTALRALGAPVVDMSEAQLKSLQKDLKVLLGTGTTGSVSLSAVELLASGAITLSPKKDA